MGELGGKEGHNSEKQTMESKPLLSPEGGSSRESPYTMEGKVIAIPGDQEAESGSGAGSGGDTREGSAEAMVKQKDDQQQEGAHRLDDYYQMGNYMYIVCLLSQMLLLVEVLECIFYSKFKK